MIELRTILAPVDFSERANLAAEHAAALARRFKARVIFLHVIPPSPYEYAAFDEGFYAASTWPSLDTVREAIEKRMDELILATAKDLETEKIVLRGDPASEIKQVAIEHKADLVVMPTHGYGAFRRFVLGSVTNKVLHDLEIPMLTGTHVPELTPVDPEPYKRVGCAIDLEEHSEEVLRWAWGLAEACTEDLVVMHAAPRIEIGGSYGDWFPAETREQIVTAAKEAVEQLVAKVGCKAQIVVGSADPVSFVRETVDENYIDLLVIGRSVKGGVLAGMRAQAYSIIREAPCPVISV
jgi:nucleotide-binding universal stress UspA family protein